jgi:hypothetical protein
VERAGPGWLPAKEQFFEVEPVDEATVRLWYGDRSSPTLSFDPIEREALR